MQIDFGEISVYLAPIAKQEGETKREAERRTIQRIITDALPVAPALTHDAAGRPLVEGISLSVSHSAGWGAIAVAPTHLTVGIDIEENAARTERVIGRVLRGAFAQDYLSGTMAIAGWTLLEAAFKCTYPNDGLTLVDFTLPSPAGGLDGKAIKLAGQPRRRLEIIASRYLGQGLPYLSVVAENQSLVP